MDDFSPANRLSVSIIGIDVILARVGINNRSTIILLTDLALVVLGLSLAHVAARRLDIPRGACCSLVSLYAMLFIYHRDYDLPILILPLIYTRESLWTESRAGSLVLRLGHARDRRRHEPTSGPLLLCPRSATFVVDFEGDSRPLFNLLHHFGPVGSGRGDSCRMRPKTR